MRDRSVVGNPLERCRLLYNHPNDPSPSVETVMGEHRLKGPTTKVGGNVKKRAGNPIRDENQKREGVFDQIKGKVQKAYGSIKGAFRGK